MAELPMPAGAVLTESSAVATSKGVALTAPGSTHTKTAYTTLIASTARACSAIIVQLEVDAVSGTNISAGLFDIAVGAAAAETVVISNLLGASQGYTVTFNQGVTTYVFPIQVPAGTRISARWQSQTTTARAFVGVTLVSGGVGILNGSGTVESWGLSTGTTIGTELDPGATINTKGAWTQLVASTARACRELSIALYNPDTDSGGVDQVRKFWTVDVAIGAAASERIIVPDLLAARAWSLSFSPGVLRLPVSIPAGTRISARCQATTNNATANSRKVGLAIYGVG